MGRDDRASVLWKNINIIKRAKSKNANSNFSSKNNRKVTPQNLGPPEPPQRDYRTDGYPQGEVGVEEETYEVFHEDESAGNIEEDFESGEKLFLRSVKTALTIYSSSHETTHRLLSFILYTKYFCNL
ncbi:uncharacterized protein LOC135156189 [Lytechinus pictus]|uniref:uncharacterized protein LOC135156189 n=1 Tax=Lytechinus pictus TaxID=7653 RepID=UPI0030B9E123